MGWRPFVRGVVMNPNDHRTAVVKVNHLSDVPHLLLRGVNRRLVLRQESTKTEPTSSLLREETINNRSKGGIQNGRNHLKRDLSLKAFDERIDAMNAANEKKVVKTLVKTVYNIS